MLIFLLACAPDCPPGYVINVVAPTTPIDTGYAIDAPAEPTVIAEWTDDQLILYANGADAAYWFGITEDGDDPGLILWTGEDCYLGWRNEFTGEDILYCHPIERGVNVFMANAYTEGLDPATETWFGIGDYRNPTVTISYSLWNIEHSRCWSWGGDYYDDVCDGRTIHWS